jgi:hypothetical protein
VHCAGPRRGTGCPGRARVVLRWLAAARTRDCQQHWALCSFSAHWAQSKAHWAQSKSEAAEWLLPRSIPPNPLCSLLSALCSLGFTQMRGACADVQCMCAAAAPRTRNDDGLLVGLASSAMSGDVCRTFPGLLFTAHDVSDAGTASYPPAGHGKRSELDAIFCAHGEATSYPPGVKPATREYAPPSACQSVLACI